MDRSRTAHAALITGFAVACLGLAAAFPKALAIAGTSVVEEAAMSVGINVPLNQIQDGQFCLAYALVYNGTPPYTFTWGGQFTNGDGSAGPKGPDQIVSGYVDAGRGELLTLHVQDSSVPPQEDSAMESLQIHSSYAYNAACEG
jgi:hypothetical protein